MGAVDTAVRKQLLKELELLDEEQLRQVEEFIAFLRFRSRRDAPVVFDRTAAAGLYREFAGEDRRMAEDGLAEYEQGLEQEDRS